MTREELNKKYGNIDFCFYSYYKYVFTFIDTEGKIKILCGGNSNDIYRFDVDYDEIYSIEDLEPFTVFENGEQIFYDGF